MDELHAPIDPIYNEAVKREIDKIAQALPHDEIAIQFDVASAVFARLERNEASSYGRTKDEMQETFSNILIDLGNRVPADIDLMFHLCYGDSNHKHVVEPTDMGDMVDFANLVSAKLSRSIQLIHMPVPRNRDDDAYFEPLRRLKLRPETELCLGLVHHTDGLDGHDEAACDRAQICRMISPSAPNAALAGAIRRPSRNCCAFTPRRRRFEPACWMDGLSALPVRRADGVGRWSPVAPGAPAAWRSGSASDHSQAPAWQTCSEHLPKARPR